MSVLNCVQNKAKQNKEQQQQNQTAEQEEILTNKNYHKSRPIFSPYENTTEQDLHFLIITCNSYYKTKVVFAVDSVWVENAVLSCKPGNALATQKLAIQFGCST